jgi:two-component system NarL family sensor kinase
MLGGDWIATVISIFKQDWFFNLSVGARWAFIIVAFLLIGVLDFSTPSEYILAYLYVIPILVSISFLKPRIAKSLVLVAFIATLLNLIFPKNVLYVQSALTNRSLAALSIIISSYFMIRYIRYHEHLQEQESLLAGERKLSQMREDFVATLTHDLKTPLLGSQKTLHYFLEGSFGRINTEQRYVLETLERSSQRQLALVEDLLSVYKADETGVQFHMELVDLDELIADILTEVQYLALERNIKLEYECRKTPPKVKGEAFQLKRVIANLLHNALNYTPANGSIQVRLSEQPQQLLVEVEDTGIGLPTEDLEKVFRRFYRSEGTRETVGTGLGLYLSRQLIQAHRGQIWAENLPAGGCRFSFTIPAIEEEAR